MSFEILKPHTQYTQAGSYFSKLLVYKNTLETQGSFLQIIPSFDISKKYEVLAQDLGISYKELESAEDIIACSQRIGSTLFWISIDDVKKEVHQKLFDSQITLQTGKSYPQLSLMEGLQEIGYDYHEYEKQGSYLRQGDIIKIFQIGGQVTLLNYWGDEIESIVVDGNKVEQVYISSLENIFKIPDQIGKKTIKNPILSDILVQDEIFLVLDGCEFHPLFEKLTHKKYQFASISLLASLEQKKTKLGIGDISIQNVEEFQNYIEQNPGSISIYSRYTKMIEEYLKDNSLSVAEVVAIKHTGFSSFEKISAQKNNNRSYISDDIIQKIFIRKRLKKKLSADIDLLLKIQKGDFVVHIDHGIGVFNGIIKKVLGEIQKEYLEIQYKDQDKLFVPITEVHRLSKYVGKENPSITPLSGKVWERKMKKIHEDIREIAEELLKNFAERKFRSGNQNILNQDKIEAFQSEFPYTYTPDQANAIDDIFSDMQSTKNMDRLIVGDVGFGKTEIAFNAAILALQNRKQVVLISPLVVLAHEHYNKAIERFKNTPYTVEVLTRLQSQAHATQVLKGLQSGSIDMVIGTHRLLGDKLKWKKLGLMIVDEEHKFGVVDKEKIKNIKSDIDILSLSATPIPRSLNLALSGVRDISLLKTPPKGRKSIETFVTRYNEKIIKDAGEQEFKRGGQIFFVHNRVSNIEVYKKQLEALFPKRKVIITHGQLPGDELEDRILDFKNKKYDILLSTTVIENGIDFSNVNTIFINECQSFGISQIHQLRGRVGRSDAQGYCYLLYHKDSIDGEAAKRIKTIVDYSYLGAGFELAMKDLEIRGGGDILGVKQSGQAQEIGVSLFLKMLEEKIEDIKNEAENTIKKVKNCQIDLMLSAGIHDNFFLSETDKLHFYREIEQIEDIDDLEYLKQSFFQNNEDGVVDTQTENLFILLETQVLAREYCIENIKRVGINYQIDFQSTGNLTAMKKFLNRDTAVKFQVTDATRLRSPTKLFENDKIFIEYVLRLLQGKTLEERKKIRLKR
ncbi:DEAD/DEAH box helicase [Candidatus Gracilibacteria bacterium]|nr:DEAD/DEAH box helicase [Candidatus Gracilibacteria bacterium]